MGWLAINEHAKTWTGPRSGKGYVHTHAYGHSHAPSLLVAACQSWGQGRGTIFVTWKQTHTEDIHIQTHTHAGMTLSVTSSSVCCGSVTSILLTSGSNVFMSCTQFQNNISATQDEAAGLVLKQVFLISCCGRVLYWRENICRFECCDVAKLQQKHNVNRNCVQEESQGGSCDTSTHMQMVH